MWKILLVWWFDSNEPNLISEMGNTYLRYIFTFSDHYWPNYGQGLKKLKKQKKKREKSSSYINIARDKMEVLGTMKHSFPPTSQ